jgi:hypothetical protein
MAPPGQPSSSQHAAAQQPDGNGNGNVGGTQSGVPAPSPSPLSAHLLQTGYPFVRQPPPSSSSSAADPAAAIQGVHSSFAQNPLSQLSPVERSHALNLRKRMMNPYLQFMCGPLLRYDTVDAHGVWRGAALIVSECPVAFIPFPPPPPLFGFCCGWRALTSPRLDRGTTFVAADSGSTYEPYPTLKYRWDPKIPASYNKYPGAQGGDLGPHPADPMAQHYRRQDDGHIEGPNVLEQRVLGTELHVYGGRGGYVCILQCSDTAVG